MAKTNHITGTLTGPFNTPDRAYIVNDATLERVAVEIDAAARDADNTDFRTTYLRAGLVLGKVTANGDYKEYDNGNSDGTETAVAILDEDVDVLDEFGNAITDPIVAAVIIKGFVDADHLNGIDAAGKVELKSAGFMLKEDY